MSDDFFDLEFAENQDDRIPMSLVLDTSDSMTVDRGNGRIPIDELNGGLDILVTEINKDPLAKRRAEISVVEYGTEVTPPTEFTTVENLVLPTLTPSGRTSTGAAVNAALDSIQDRKKQYRENGIQYFRPIVLLISDGLATDDIKEAAKRVKEMEGKKQVLFFAVGIAGADLDQLSEFSDARPALGLKDMDFASLFEWLSASAVSVSASTPGDAVKLPDASGWASIEV